MVATENKFFFFKHVAGDDTMVRVLMGWAYPALVLLTIGVYAWGFYIGFRSGNIFLSAICATGGMLTAILFKEALQIRKIIKTGSLKLTYENGKITKEWGTK